ncbi:hypothetical protein AV530_002884 [Patagioenas fasciata monilis]|uniref:Uncharacterized protein n=1 Tax=Patagioenas fasciata monilis TaxID=372326 RepID=A0A1V4K9T3_PATFA|nr:hypothetical protein AV530_002884 [Patagioenas fasciata monilis]
MPGGGEDEETRKGSRFRPAFLDGTLLSFSMTLYFLLTLPSAVTSLRLSSLKRNDQLLSALTETCVSSCDFQ